MEYQPKLYDARLSNVLINRGNNSFRDDSYNVYDVVFVQYHGKSTLAYSTVHKCEDLYIVWFLLNIETLR